MNTRNLNTKDRRKFSLLLSVTTVFAAAFIMAQLLFSPTMVQTVYAGSTLTPTPVPVDTATPVPAPTDTPAPLPTDTPVPPPTNTPNSNSGGSSSSPAPTPTTVPVVPQEIPELGVGAPWQPLILTATVLLFALMIAVMQVRHLLQAPSDKNSEK